MRAGLTVNVEVRLRGYVHAGSERGAGGSRRDRRQGGLLLSGGIDSPVATYMMAKRGLKIIPVHFFSFPIHRSLPSRRFWTSPRSLKTTAGT